jgi:hypothetical protein
MLAVKLQNTETAWTILEFGTDPTILLLRDVNGCTPLHVAALKTDMVIAELLLKHGPTEHLYTENCVGKTLLDIASLQGPPQDLNLSRFPLALSSKKTRTTSCTSCGGTHVTSGVTTRQTPSGLTGIRTMKTTAWQLDASSSRNRRGSGRRGLSRRSGRVDIAWTSIRDADSWDEGS